MSINKNVAHSQDSSASYDAGCPTAMAAHPIAFLNLGASATDGIDGLH